MVDDVLERVAVCRLDALEEGAPTLVTARGRKIVLARVGDEVFAMRDACPHNGASLSCGWISAKRRELICPWHRFRFDLRTGASVTNPALLNETQPVVVEDGNVIVEILRPTRATAS